MRVFQNIKKKENSIGIFQSVLPNFFFLNKISQLIWKIYEKYAR